MESGESSKDIEKIEVVDESEESDVNPEDLDLIEVKSYNLGKKRDSGELHTPSQPATIQGKDLEPPKPKKKKLNNWKFKVLDY